MGKLFRMTLSCLFVLFFIPNAALASQKKDSAIANERNWEEVMNAIIQVESNGDANARRGNSVGAMQITPILVLECNQILKKRKSKKRYRLSDRLSVAKSKEMFLLFQSAYNPKNSIERAIRSWNGGLNYSIKCTQRYFEKVMKAMK